MQIALKHERKSKEVMEAQARKNSRLAVEALMKNETETLQTQEEAVSEKESIIASLKVCFFVRVCVCLSVCVRARVFACACVRACACPHTTPAPNPNTIQLFQDDILTLKDDV